MIRIVLVGWAENDWRTFRQPQWMAQVRSTPEAAQLPRLHFDIDEDRYGAALIAWDGSSREAAIDILCRFGANEIIRS